MNTSVETIESEFPVKMVRHELIPNSAGAGQYRGGLGVRRDYQMVSDTTFSIRSDRNTHSPQGVQGGGPARSGRCFINPDTANQVAVHSKCPGMNLKRGDILSVQSAGGGGWGNPKKRDRDAVLADIKNGYITKDVAREQYGFDS
jgi:N-methylhydantoinase B